ncbi:MAG: alpha-mannosidase [Kiritimatiellia bacterium]|jgi:alpha-mannosidase
MNLPQLEQRHAIAKARHDLLWSRIRSQIAFAEFVAEGKGKAAPENWAPAIAAAKDFAAKAVETTFLERACAAVETALEPLAPAAKAYRVHLVGHAHIDMNWMWSWPETVSVVVDTFSTVLDLLEEFPGFHFSQSQASVYAIVEKFRPDLLGRIAKYVAEGRWEITASHWVECDKNMTGGEALARHILYTRRYLSKLFGDAFPKDGIDIDWAPDTFGHSAQVPAYLRRSGIRYLYLHRPGTWKQPVPELFRWEGPDGSRVLVRNDMKRGYGCVLDPGTMLEITRSVRDSVGLDESMVVYGVGDHGGGPTRRDLLFALEMQSWPIFPTLRFSTAKAFFDAVAPKAESLPLLCGELNTEFTGCYTSQSLVKRSIRLAEARMKDAEFATSLATLAGGPAYPAADFEEQWRNILFLHFHDILPGSCVPDTRTHAHGLFQNAMAFSSSAETRALRYLAGRVDTASIPGASEPDVEFPVNAMLSGQSAGAGIRAAEGAVSDYHGHGGVSSKRPFVLFNPTARDRREVVELTVWDREHWQCPMRMHDLAFEAVLPDGSVKALQVLSKGSEWGHSNVRLLLPVDIPAFGYASVLVREAAPGAEPAACAVPEKERVQSARLTHHCPYSIAERSPMGMENGLVRVTFDRTTGRISSFFDKRANRELIDPASNGAGLEYSVERPHGMTAWLVDSSNPPESPRLTSMRELRGGPYAAAVECVYQAAESSFTVTSSLAAGDDKVRMRLDAIWMQRGTPETGIPNLRFAIPLALTGAVGSYEIPFGSAARPRLRPDEEVPAMRWAHVGGREGGCLLLNECSHGHALEGSTLRLNLLRASYDPDALPELGRHTFGFAIAPAPSTCDGDAFAAIADAYAHPILPIGTPVHGGDLPLSASLVKIQGEAAFAVSGLKLAEDGSSLILRLFETDGQGGTLGVKIDPVLGRLAGAEAVDLHEQPCDSKCVTCSGDTVRITLKPCDIVTVRLSLKK